MICFIIPGTTFTLSYETDVDISGCEAALLTINQGSKILFEREKDTMTFSDDGKTVSVTLTQEESLLLPDEETVAVQLRVLMNGAAMSTFATQFHTARTLSRKELRS